MGWTSGDFTGHLTAEAVIVFAMGKEVASRALDSVMEGGVVYVAVQVGDNCEVEGLVLIVRREGRRLHVKPISEGMGPADACCPPRILHLLTTTSNEAARNWRERCWASHRNAE